MSVSNKNWQIGTVHWFDEKSGEGLIKSASGELYFVHHSAINVDKKAKAKSGKVLRDNQKVKFQLVDDVIFLQVWRVKEV